MTDSVKTQKDGVRGASGRAGVNKWRCRRVAARRGHGSSVLCLLSSASLPSGGSWVISSYNKPVIWYVKCFSELGEPQSQINQTHRRGLRNLRCTAGWLEAQATTRWTEPLTCGIECCLLVGSVRIECNCRTRS